MNLTKAHVWHIENNHDILPGLSVSLETIITISVIFFVWFLLFLKNCCFPLLKKNRANLKSNISEAVKWRSPDPLDNFPQKIFYMNMLHKKSGKKERKRDQFNREEILYECEICSHRIHVKDRNLNYH